MPGGQYPGLPQHREICEVLALDAVKLCFRVVRGTARPAQQHEFECFEVHTPLSAPIPRAAAGMMAW